MKTVIVYPLPFDAWDTFEPFVKRFAETFKQFPPGVNNYELWLMCCWGKPTEEIRQLFYGTKARFIDYPGHGCDLGAQQYASFHAVGRGYEDAFLICLTSRCFFHREGWGLRYQEARAKHGRGLYGSFASWESDKPHICTRGHALDAEMFRAYPHEILTREDGQKAEVGEWSLSDWFRKQELPLVQILWDEDNLAWNWRKPEGTFRRGEQNACLMWDKHTQAFADADEDEKLRLRAMSDVPSWSQEGEDRWIFDHADGLQLPLYGTFVEVGAYNGVTSSNTLLFERMGWNGLCIEADPDIAAICAENRKCMTQVAAIGSTNHAVTFYVNREDRGLSGLARPGEPITVPGRTLKTALALDDIAKVDLLSIDTEGTELDVWRSRGTVQPKIVIMEYKTCDLPPQYEPITKQMRADGYRLVHQTTHNLIFALPEILEGSKAAL